MKLCTCIWFVYIQYYLQRDVVLVKSFLFMDNCEFSSTGCQRPRSWLPARSSFSFSARSWRLWRQRQYRPAGSSPERTRRLQRAGTHREQTPEEKKIFCCHFCSIAYQEYSYTGSRIRIFPSRIPDPGSKKDPGSRSGIYQRI